MPARHYTINLRELICENCSGAGYNWVEIACEFDPPESDDEFGGCSVQGFERRVCMACHGTGHQLAYIPCHQTG